MNEILVAPSVLAADYGDLKKAVGTIEQSGADWIHLDVMDGTFVPQITFGHKMVGDLRPLTDLPFDVHLMVNHPGTFIEDFVNAGSDFITIHAEAEIHLNRTLNFIKQSGCRCGVSIVPSTPVYVIKEVLALVDLVLIMTVNPGFGGQKMINGCLDKIGELKEIKTQKDYNYYIQADGGVNEETYLDLINAGAEVLVTGSSFFTAANPVEYVNLLKKRIKV